MPSMTRISTLAAGLATAGALLLSGCSSSTTAADPTVAAGPPVSAPAAPTLAVSAPALSEDTVDQVVEVWTCENDGTKTTCTCEGEQSSCEGTVGKPSNVKGALGTVKWFNATKGYGFIQPEDGSKDVFVHISAVQRANLQGLDEGQKVSYDVLQERGKSSAGNLKAL